MFTIRSGTSIADRAPGLGRVERELHRFLLAELADDNDVGVLPKGSDEPGRKRVRVAPDLSLLHDTARAVPVAILDRIFHSDDVVSESSRQLLNQRCQGRRLAGARWSSDENQTRPLRERCVHGRRQRERPNRRGSVWQKSDRQHDAALF